MPQTYLYPGLYVQEIPSGVHPITGVPTSNTAFVDFIARGPLNQAVELTSLADFERSFGGVDTRSEASYAILQYYLNGGSISWCVRVAASNATPASVDLPGENGGPGSGAPGSGVPGSGPPGSGPPGSGPPGSGPPGSGPPGSGPPGPAAAAPALQVSAANPGEWGNNLRVAVDHNVRDATGAIVAQAFNLVVQEVQPSGAQLTVVTTEVWRGLSMDTTSAQFVEAVINGNSTLISVKALSVGSPPAATADDAVTASADSAFVRLGQGPNSTAGSSGYDPHSPEWLSGEGASALTGDPDKHTGLYALTAIAPDIFNILCLPSVANLGNDQAFSVLTEAEALCEQARAFLLIDPPSSLDSATDPSVNLSKMKDFVTALEGQGLRHRNAAVYYPRLQIPDPLGPQPRTVGPSGTLAGIYASTDAARGVWKAPAGSDAALRGASVLVKLTDSENGELNPRGVNALRVFPVFGGVSWGARTLVGADQIASEWKYIPVRRTALFIEESLYEGLKWTVFEPNDEPLWSQIRLNVGAFMHGLFRQGAFQGKSPQEAYLVKCDSETTTQADIDLGVVNILVGFAPLKPAEFVVIQIQQLAGQAQP
jgi:phage tail sheath protein FI